MENDYTMIGERERNYPNGSKERKRISVKSFTPQYTTAHGYLRYLGFGLFTLVLFLTSST
jgi:hypothetical protein